MYSYLTLHPHAVTHRFLAIDCESIPLTIIAQLAYFRQYMLSSIFCLNFEKFKGSSFDEDVSFRSQKANSLLETLREEISLQINQEKFKNSIIFCRAIKLNFANDLQKFLHANVSTQKHWMTLSKKPPSG